MDRGVFLGILCGCGVSPRLLGIIGEYYTGQWFIPKEGGWFRKEFTETWGCIDRPCITNNFQYHGGHIGES